MGSCVGIVDWLGVGYVLIRRVLSCIVDLVEVVDLVQVLNQ